jgi:hypothetical protein
MSSRRPILAALALLAALLAGAPAPQAQPADEPPAPGPAPAPEPAPGALSPENASYRIEVRLDPEAKLLAGSQVSTWRNTQDVPASELRFHLYWNAWRNTHSTWMREERLTGDLPHDLPEDAWSWIEVDSIRLGGGGGEDVTGEARFDAPDDGNPEDRTVLVVPLPAPVAPGGTVEVAMDWRSKFPRTFARTGFRGNFFQAAHWFPKLGVFQGADGWNCHQFHSNTEFFSDYGVYDVAITTPEAFVVGSTGLQVGEPRLTGEGEDGAVTRRFHQADVHAFTWTASPDYRVATDRFEVPGLPPVDLRLLYQPEHEDQVARHLEATKHTLELYGTWYGPYPYPQLTVVDPAWESGAGGMEYPTLFTAGTRIFNPPGGGSPEGVTIHEAGHQFWYAIVGDNEFEDAWIDEGLNTFSTARAYEAAYGEEAFVQRYLRPPGTGWRGFLPVLYPEVRSPRFIQGIRLDRYRHNATRDVPATPTFRYYPESHASITYSKTATWLMTLERYLGWDTLQEILATFFERWKFRHPTGDDFIAVANEVSRARRGVDLDWFFDQVYRDDVSFDYAIERADSFDAAPEGLVEEGGELTYHAGHERDGSEDEEEGEDDAGKLYRTEVVARRIGEGVFPVEVLLVFEDGAEERRLWDGRYRWQLFVHEGPSKLRYAAVDPERTLLLDLDYTNNSRLRKDPGWLAPAKWASKWMIWLQDLLQTSTYFV